MSLFNPLKPDAIGGGAYSLQLENHDERQLCKFLINMFESEPTTYCKDMSFKGNGLEFQIQSGFSTASWSANNFKGLPQRGLLQCKVETSDAVDFPDIGNSQAASNHTPQMCGSTDPSQKMKQRKEIAKVQLGWSFEAEKGEEDEQDEDCKA